MRRNWLLIGIGLLMAVFAVAAIACDDDDDEDKDIGDGNGGVLRLSVELSEVDGSGVTGTANLSVNGDGILVAVTMEGLPEGAHANHLHGGSCDEQGAIHVTLDQIVADENGDGSQTTANNEEPLSHYETDHYFAVHEGDNDTVGAVISCGDIVAG